MQLLQMFHDADDRIPLHSAMEFTFKLIISLVLMALVVPLTACSQSEEGSRSARRAIAQSQAIAADFLRTELALSPETASRLGLEQALGRSTAFALDNHSQAGFERRRLVRIELLQRLRQRPRLPDDHPLTRDLLIAEIALTDLIALEQFGYGRFNYAAQYPYAIDPYSGIWIEGPNLLAYRQSINTPEQAAAYITRLKSLSEALQDTRRRLIADQAAGIYLPLDLAEETERRVARLADQTPNALALLSLTFQALTLDVPDLDPDQREQMIDLVETEIDGKLRPAYVSLIETLSETSDDFPDQAGIWALPNGAALYATLLEFATGTKLNTERLHTRHIDDVARLRTDLDSLFVIEPDPETGEIAVTEPLPDRLSARLIWAISAFGTAAGAPQEASPSDLDLPEPISEFAPKSTWQRIAAATPFEEQAVQTRRYVELLATDPIATWGREADLPHYRILIDYAAIREGWRLYVWSRRAPAENRLAQIAGLRIELIQHSLAAADTGLHVERWSLPEATEYIAVNTGLAEPLARQLALTVMARPGYNAAIASSFHTIEALSTRARAVLGDRYSEADFQRALIEAGPRPLPLIEQDIEAWYGARLGN
ncbi:MAG: DUF885 family protein [Henriciella sp.]